MAEDLPLVGRRAELAQLTSALTPGQGPRAAVLVGEAGVGKTRLAAEAIRAVRGQGVRVLSGGCLPLAETVPFLPITEALRGLDDRVLEHCPAHVRDAVARIMPGWSDVSASGPLGGWERGRLFAALRDLFAAAPPAALVVEDVHWADPSTLDFLVYHHAVDRDGHTPLVLTCRDEEIGSRLVEFEHRPGVVRLTLERLSRSEVRQHVGALLGGPAATAYVNEVFSRADGNAFFTEQLVTARHGRRLPEGLAQLLVSRAETVDTDCRLVLETLAVAGGPLDEGLLRAVTGLDESTLAGAIRRLAGARLLDPLSEGGRYRLRHALVGEALAEAMSAGERRAGHARLAEELSLAGADGHAGEIAGHWAAAGRKSDEAPWRLIGAREAEKMTAFREAAGHWVRLIEIGPDATAGMPDRADLYLAALAALDRCGDSATAGPLAERAVSELAAALDRPRLALLRERVGGYRWLDDARAALQPMETAMALLDGLPRGREFALVAQAYAGVLHDLGRRDEAYSLLEQALEVCRAENLPVESIKVIRDLGDLLQHKGDVEKGQKLMAEAATIADRNGDAMTIASIAYNRAESMLVLGQLAEAAEAAAQAWDGSRRAGLEGHPTAEFLAYCHFEALAESGRPAVAAELIPATVEATAVSCTALARAYLETLSGDHDAASARLAEIDVAISPVNLDSGAYVTARGEIDLWLGRPDQALARIRQLHDRLDPAQLSGFTGPTLRIGATACADLAESARLRGDPDDEARGWAAELVAAYDRMRPDPFATHPYWSFAPAEGATWRAELTRVAGQPDPQAWVEAATEWQRRERPHRVAYARWRQGEALLAGGKRAEAARVLREAAETAQRHAPLTAGIQETIQLARLTLPAKKNPSPYGLTTRETAVLALIAEGLTNVQIGRRLFISQSTVSVHITNLMRKLGVSNRAQAAARGQRAGLV
jgi:DNA-binding CsgD family transcriptional regulator